MNTTHISENNWASYLHLSVSATKQYNLVPAKGGNPFGW